MEVPKSEHLKCYHLVVVKFGNVNRYLLPNDVGVIVKAKYRVKVNNVSGV